MSAEPTLLLAHVRCPSGNSQALQNIESLLKTWLAPATNETPKQAGESKPLLSSYLIERLPVKSVSKFSDETIEPISLRLEVLRPRRAAFLSVVKRWTLPLPLEVQNLSRRHHKPRHHFANASFTFGNLTDERTLLISRAAPQDVGVEVVFEHLDNSVSVFFNSKFRPTFDLDENVFAKLAFSYKFVRRLIVDACSSSGPISLCFHLKASPHLFTAKDSLGRQMDRNDDLEIQDAEMQRSTRIMINDDTSIKADNFGHSMAYVISIPETKEKDVMAEFLLRLIRRVAVHGEVSFCSIQRLCGRGDFGREEYLGIPQATVLVPEDFNVWSTLYACLKYSDELEDRLAVSKKTKNFADLVQSFVQESSTQQRRSIIISALEDICNSLESGDIIDPVRALHWLIEKHTVKPKVSKKPAEGTCFLRRIFVTPSRVIIRPAEMHVSNRILRNYEPDFALRVSFRDDDFQKLTFSCGDLLQSHAIVIPLLQGGIKILGRVYQFLAASSSQLRDHGLYMYAQDTAGRNASTIRDEMGDFSSISNVAKKMARMGQTLSSTQATTIIADHEFNVVEDVTYSEAVHPVSGKRYCFSDGVGTISPQLMTEVSKSMGWEDDPPSAIQIRFRGCKGMLSLDPRLPGRQICLRKSMVKFLCPEPHRADGSQPNIGWYLEVIKRSAPTPLYLNRQVIPLLEFQGIGNRVFLRLGLKTILEYAQSLVCQRSALNCLSAFVKTRLPFEEMRNAGWDFLCDPFCNSMLHHLLLESLKNIKHKARVQVPLNTGRNMLGVMDETGLLCYGQVFVQYTSIVRESSPNDLGNQPATTTIVTGKITVSKCPCVHPGDVRVLEAVDIPELRHIKDCIVFPSRGMRPHPQEISGSDLDGDEYIVIWDKDLIFPARNCEPFIYADHSTQSPRSFTIFDEIHFFNKYIINDVIGVASNAHLALSDYLGIKDQLCLGLVGKISAALDFAKTEEPTRILPEERPTKYPDFMEKTRHSYKSKRALGHLYRAVREVTSTSGIPLWLGSMQFLEVAGWHDHKKSAEASRDQYVERLEAIKQQHGISTEVEIFTGTISRVNNYNSFKSDRENVEILIEKQRQHLYDITRKEFFTSVNDFCTQNGVSDNKIKEFIKMQMASAWFMVVYGTDVIEKKRCFSFAWSIASVLAQTLNWLKEQPGSVYKPPQENALLRVFEDRLEEQKQAPEYDVHHAKFARVDSTLALMRQWFVQKPQLKGLAGCSCFDQIYKTYDEQHPVATQWTPARKVLDILHKLSLGEFSCRPSLMCLMGCSSVLETRDGQLPRIALIAARQLLELAVNKDVCCFGLPCVEGFHESYEDYDEVGPLVFNVVTPELHQLLQSDRHQSFAQCIDRLGKWTGAEVSISTRYNRRRRRNRHLPPSMQVSFNFAGTAEQCHRMTELLFNENFERAFAQDRMDMLA